MQVSYELLTEANCSQVERLNYTIFQFSYAESFYKRQLQVPELSRVALVNGKVAGAILCRLEGTNVYIATLGVLSSYREKGIGATLLQQVLDYVKASLPNITSVVLHVQAENDEAIAFYTKPKFGFKITNTIPNYYQKPRPGDAHYLVKDLA